MVADIDGVVKLEPLPSNVPPDAILYQSMVVPLGLVADIVTIPVPHLDPLMGKVGAPGKGLTVAVTGVLVEDMQPVLVFLACA